MSWTGKKSPGGNAIKNYEQGDIVLIDFGRPNSGNEQEGRRPVLIVSNDLLNQTDFNSWLYWVFKEKTVYNEYRCVIINT